MTSTTDFDNAEITQQYSHINTRFDLLDEELDNDNSSARLFERSRIKALAGERDKHSFWGGQELFVPDELLPVCQLEVNSPSWVHTFAFLVKSHNPEQLGLDTLAHSQNAHPTPPPLQHARLAFLAELEGCDPPVGLLNSHGSVRVSAGVFL